jgi:hypothetical protein
MNAISTVLTVSWNYKTVKTVFKLRVSYNTQLKQGVNDRLNLDASALQPCAGAILPLAEFFLSCIVYMK